MIESIRFRAEGGLVVLQVLHRKTGNYYDRDAEWQDAKVEDLLEVARFTRIGEDYEQLGARIAQLEDITRNKFNGPDA